jgi:Protein of unknown function (DUF4239)
MNFYWLYDIPTWALFLLVCSFVAFFAVGGCLLLRDRFDRWLGLSVDINDMVGNFLSFTGMFFSIMLGLVAVGAWDTFNNTQEKVNAEAVALSALYRDIKYFPGDERVKLEDRLRTYTRQVIDTEWPQQREGRIPTIGIIALGNFADALMASEIKDARSQILLAEVFRQYNILIQARRLRVQSLSEALPASLWMVITVGTVFNIVITWLFVVRHRRLDILLNLLVSVLLGSVLAFIIAMDNPFRGELSISSDPFIDAYEQLMSY